MDNRRFAAGYEREVTLTQRARISIPRAHHKKRSTARQTDYHADPFCSHHLWRTKHGLWTKAMSRWSRLPRMGCSRERWLIWKASSISSTCMEIPPRLTSGMSERARETEALAHPSA